jgi:hypothetical protein
MKDRPTPLASILGEKKKLLHMFVIAAVLAFSVGTLSGLLIEQKIVPHWMVLASQILLVGLSFVWLGKDLVSSLSFKEDISAVIFIDKHSNELLEVRDYEFSRNLQKTLRAVKAENKAIYNEWDNDPLCSPTANPSPVHSEETTSTPFYISIVRMKVEEHKVPTAAKLLEEAASFVILEELSIHLSTYFNDSTNDYFIKEYSRNDIPAFLLKNRVLNLLSTPIEQRDIFIKMQQQHIPHIPPGELFSVWGSDGSMYRRFNLVLPKGSTIHYSEIGSINIETNRFAFELSAKYTGSHAVVDPTFIERYVGADSDSIELRKVTISLSGRIKPLSLLSGSKWEYYEWLDSFRSKLVAACDFKAFQQQINWDVIKPLMYSMRPPAEQRKPIPRPDSNET